MSGTPDFEFIDCDEVARILKFTPQHIRRLAEDGVIPGKKYGREWRFLRSELLRSHMEACAGNHNLSTGPVSCPMPLHPAQPRPSAPNGLRDKK